MLAYRHAFHAGNHADVLKHLVLVALLRHLNLKPKGWRLVDTHAGAGGYSLRSNFARQHHEHADGIARLWPLRGKADVPALLADYLGCIEAFNAGAALTQYPGSPAFAAMLQRDQDQLRFFERHPTDHKILASFAAGRHGVEVTLGDGFAALKSLLPPPTRRGLVLIDPPYELKADYARTLAALREALERFADGLVMIWLPQLQLLEATQLPQRLKASCLGVAKKGWMHARLTVRRAPAAGGGFGLLGSSVFVANPPHTLAAELREVLPLLAGRLAQDDAAAWAVEQSS
jgi:23S rRNA (adenine2030-N6)-methyltransferase